MAFPHHNNPALPNANPKLQRLLLLSRTRPKLLRHLQPTHLTNLVYNPSGLQRTNILPSCNKHPHHATHGDLPLRIQ